MTGHISNLVNRKRSLAGCLFACMLANFSLNVQSVLADSEFSTAGMNFAGADGTGSLDQSAMNQLERGYHTGQALDNRAMPVETTPNNTLVQNVMRPGVKNAAGIPLAGAVLSGALGAQQGLGGSRTTQLDKIFGGTPLNKLPKTDTGSFVAQSGMRDDIYGDEGVLGPPPLFDFSTINTGISSKKLTTGHKSNLPSAWGYPN